MRSHPAATGAGGHRRRHRRPPRHGRAPQRPGRRPASSTSSPASRCRGSAESRTAGRAEFLGITGRRAAELGRVQKQPLLLPHRPHSANPARREFVGRTPALTPRPAADTFPPRFSRPAWDLLASKGVTRHEERSPTHDCGHRRADRVVVRRPGVADLDGRRAGTRLRPLHPLRPEDRSRGPAARTPERARATALSDRGLPGASGGGVCSGAPPVGLGRECPACRRGAVGAVGGAGLLHRPGTRWSSRNWRPQPRFSLYCPRRLDLRRGHQRRHAPAAVRLGILGSGGIFQGSGFRVQGSGFRVQGSGFRVQGSGFRGQGAGFRVQGAGARCP